MHIEKRYYDKNLWKIEINNVETKAWTIKIWTDEASLENKKNIKTSLMERNVICLFIMNLFIALFFL
jgi:hypothetical protein